MSKLVRIIVFLACIAGFASSHAAAKTSIVFSKHNLSRTGPGDIKALTEDRICVFCHAPHNANPRTPLWNKNIEGINYVLYTAYSSSTLHSQAPATGPTGPTRLCLSCHDGTIALGQVLQPAEKIAMTVVGGIPAARPSNFGTSLANHHPVSFSYYSALPNTELSPVPPAGLQFYDNGMMHCSTCHDPHDNTNRKFLRVDSSRSALCTLCHVLTDWAMASHNTRQNGWNLTPPNPWPRTGIGTDLAWTTVQQNGCENCHAPHNSGGRQWLMNYAEEEQNCYVCHNGNVATRNIQAQFQKPSHHMVEATTIGVTPNHHDAGESPVMVTGHVECTDCHNPHVTNNLFAATAPAVPASMRMVSGVDMNGGGITPPSYAANEYEVCFKCHAGASAQSLFPPIPRVAKDVNARLAFQTVNPSFHPVAGLGKNPDVPSIPSAAEPALSTTSMIYCTDCHDSNESPKVGGIGPRGPHGSTFSPLIRERYETMDNTIESPDTYALCYRCHNRISILSDESFRKNASGRGGHSGHIITSPSGTAVNAPCSICHDPHGVRDDNMLTGSHTHLINFDTRYVGVLPSSGNTAPVFTDDGIRAGSCTLICHGVEHSAATHRYP